MLSKEQMQQFLQQEFPQSSVRVVELVKNSATVHQAIDISHLRPGNTVSGPVMMGLADVAMYVAVLNEIGLVPLAVTTNLNINFLRKPAADKDIIAVCRLLKCGRSLAVGEVSIYSEGESEVVAHAVATYAIPPNRNTTPVTPYEGQG